MDVLRSTNNQHDSPRLMAGLCIIGRRFSSLLSKSHSLQSIQFLFCSGNEKSLFFFGILKRDTLQFRKATTWVVLIEYRKWSGSTRRVQHRNVECLALSCFPASAASLRQQNPSYTKFDLKAKSNRPYQVSTFSVFRSGRCACRLEECSVLFRILWDS